MVAAGLAGADPFPSPFNDDMGEKRNGAGVDVHRLAPNGEYAPRALDWGWKVPGTL